MLKEIPETLMLCAFAPFNMILEQIWEQMVLYICSVKTLENTCVFPL